MKIDNKNNISVILSLVSGIVIKFSQYLLWYLLEYLKPQDLSPSLFIIFPYITDSLLFFIFSIILGKKYPKNILNIPAGMVIGSTLATVIMIVTLKPQSLMSAIPFTLDFYLLIPTLIICCIGYAIGEKISQKDTTQI